MEQAMQHQLAAESFVPSSAAWKWLQKIGGSSFHPPFHTPFLSVSGRKYMVLLASNRRLLKFRLKAHQNTNFS